MSPLDLVIPDAAEPAIPFSVRLAERRRTPSVSARAQSDRRAHSRRSATDLRWLRAVRVVQGYDIQLVDLSEGGALIEINSPLKPGTRLTLEIDGSGLETSVPLEVLRCYVSNLRGDIATYRGACAFDYLIDLPGLTGPSRTPQVPAGGFVGTDAALAHLLEKCAIGTAGRAADGPQVTLERGALLHVLTSLQMRRSTDQADPLSRYTAQLLGAILPVLQRGAPREVAADLLEERLRELPERWQSRLQPTRGRLISLIEHCTTTPVPEAPPRAVLTHAPSAPAAAPITSQPVDAAISSGFQKIVVRYVDGDLVKGFTQDFHQSRPQFSLWPSIHAAKSDRLVIPMGRLKAVFFVRDFAGNAAYRERKTFATRGGHGRRLEVTFLDGEVVLGTTLNYRPDGQGFFLNPVDTNGNNSRIFVVASAVRRVRFL
jgi:hypothetical protein